MIHFNLHNKQKVNHLELRFDRLGLNIGGNRQVQAGRVCGLRSIVHFADSSCPATLRECGRILRANDTRI